MRTLNIRGDRRVRCCSHPACTTQSGRLAVFRQDRAARGPGHALHLRIGARVARSAGLVRPARGAAATSASTTGSPIPPGDGPGDSRRSPSDGSPTATTPSSRFIFATRSGRTAIRITAHDFVYSLRRGLAPEFAARTAYLAYYIKGAQAYNEGKGKAEDVGVDAVDDRTVRFTLDAAGSVLPGTGRASVLPARAAKGDRGARPGVDAAAATSSRAARSRCRRGSRTTGSSTSATRTTGTRRT